MVSVVYISEAHGEDAWPIGNKYRTDIDSELWSPALKCSVTNEERCERVSFVKARYGLPDSVKIYVDPIGVQNSFESIFGGWPVGFYLIHEGKLVYQVVPRHGMFILDTLWLKVKSILKQ